MRHNKQSRRGATAVECAVVYPILFLLLVGLVIGAMGIFRYQEMASIARETARYASVHGTLYAKEAGVTPPSPSDIYQAVIVPRAAALDLSRLTYSITYNTSNAPSHIDISTGDVTPHTNTVTVVISYQWIPEGFLGGITLTSTSQMTMSY
jgi:Flp pilus assembly protein TadG